MGLHSHIQSTFIESQERRKSSLFIFVLIAVNFLHMKHLSDRWFLSILLDYFISHYIFSSLFLSRPAFTLRNKHREAAKYNLASFKLVLCKTWSLAELHGDIHLLRCQMHTHFLLGKTLLMFHKVYCQTRFSASPVHASMCVKEKVTVGVSKTHTVAIQCQAVKINKEETQLTDPKQPSHHNACDRMCA